MVGVGDVEGAVGLVLGVLDALPERAPRLEELVDDMPPPMMFTFALSCSILGS